MNDNEELILVSFETAWIAKQKGFDLTCLKCYWFDKSKDPKLTVGFNRCDNLGLEIEMEEEKKAAKERGYDDYFMGLVAAPSQDQLDKWLRSRGLFVEVRVDFEKLATVGQKYYFTIVNLKTFERIEDSSRFNSYEEAKDFGMQAALKI